MTPQELKNSILQLAIQGKLVEQRPEEGTGEELYKQIQAEKARLIKEGKIKKEKPLPPISDNEIPFEIPESWKWVHLSDCGLSQTGTTPSRNNPEFFGTYIPFLSPGDIFNGKVNYCNQGISEEGYNHARVCEKGSIIQVCIGGSIGKAAIVDRRVSFNQQINSISPILVFSNYLFSVLSSSWIVTMMKERSGGTATPIINRGLWDLLVIPLPPLSEQKRIVARIEELLPLVEQYAKAYDRLEQLNKQFPDDMKKSILQLAIQGKLVEQRPEEGTGEELYKQIQAEKAKLIKEGKIKKDKSPPPISEDEIPFDIPDSWQWVKLGDISSYAHTKKKISANEIRPEVWSLDLEDIQKGGKLLVKLKASERKIIGEKVSFSKGDILYSKLRPYLKKVLVADDCGICSSEIVPFSVYGNVEQSFVVHLLVSPFIDDYINSVSYGMKMPRVGTETMVNLIIPLPPLAEQKRIVAKIEELLPLCDLLNRKWA